MNSKRRIDKLEQQLPAQKVIFLWSGDDEPVPAEGDDVLYIRFKWEEVPLANRIAAEAK